MTLQSVAIGRLGGTVNVVVSGRQPSASGQILAQDVQTAQLSEGAASRDAIPH